MIRSASSEPYLRNAKRCFPDSVFPTANDRDGSSDVAMEGSGMEEEVEFGETEDIAEGRVLWRLDRRVMDPFLWKNKNP